MNISSFTAEELKAITLNLHKLPVHEQMETLTLIEELADRKNAEEARRSLLAFAQRVAPVLQIETEPKVFMIGAHHRQLAKLMDAVARGEKRRIVISVAPRMGKSLMSSYLFPAWYLGLFPNRRVIMASHTGDMATGFGRKVRDLISTPEYRSVFPDVDLKADSKAAGQWATNKGGEYYAVGVGGALAGRGANLCCAMDSKVISHRGIIEAHEVQIGDRLLGITGYGSVTHTIRTSHTQVVRINNMRGVSLEHPLYVVGKGFIPAEQVVYGDALLTPRRSTMFMVKLGHLITTTKEHLCRIARELKHRCTTSGL